MRFFDFFLGSSTEVVTVNPMSANHQKTPGAAAPGSNFTENPESGEVMTGAQAVIRTLEELGVVDVFGIPGGAILSTFDPLYDSKKLNFILTRHEQGAAHAAEGYAKSTGKVGVALVTSGPAATNLLTGLADAMMDSVPLVAITGQVGKESIGTDAFQESDIVGASMPLTKHGFLVMDPQEVPEKIAEAFHIASTGRPGPVLVDVSKTAQVGKMTFNWPPKLNLPGYKVPGKPSRQQISAAAAEIAAARRPVLYVGGGIFSANATDELAQLAEMTGAAVVTTLTARGAYPDEDPKHMGMPGMHGSVSAVLSMQQADLLVALGTRFDDRVTGDTSTFASHAKVIHVDIDAAEIGKIREADVPIVGDLKEVLGALLRELPGAYKQYGKPDLSPWIASLTKLKDKYPLYFDDVEDGLVTPQKAIKVLGDIADEDTIYVTGVGQHQMWASQFITYRHPRTYISSCGLGTMGFGVPAAMGAKVANPDREVWLIDGDGSFQMTNQELATCTQSHIPIKVMIINNSSLGMVRQWQTLFYNERYSQTDLHDGARDASECGRVGIPDFMMLAKAYGAEGIRITKPEELEEGLKKAHEINDRPVVVEVLVSPDAMVFPMVPAGQTNDKVFYTANKVVTWED